MNTCPNCQGRGVVEWYAPDGEKVKQDCKTCDGTGLVSRVCLAVTRVIPFRAEGGGGDPLPCLLRAPHPGYRHYAAFPGEPDRFWLWDDNDTAPRSE